MSIERTNLNMPTQLSAQALPERYRQPSVMTQAGQVDRRHECEHVLRMRDLQRQAIEAAAEQARQEVELNAWMDCRGRVNSEAKYKLLRNHKETQVLAAENSLLQAQCDILDDEYYRDLRIRLNNWR